MKTLSFLFAIGVSVAPCCLQGAENSSKNLTHLVQAGPGTNLPGGGTTPRFNDPFATRPMSEAPGSQPMVPSTPPAVPNQTPMAPITPPAIPNEPPTIP